MANGDRGRDAPRPHSGGDQYPGESDDREQYRRRHRGSFAAPPEGTFASAATGSGGSRSTRDHRGRGPRNYRRSDERITDEVCELLARHPDLDATEIEVRVDDGEVSLTGIVEDRRAKRLAEDIVERVADVYDVHNRLELRTTRHSRKSGPDPRETASETPERKLGM